MSRAGEPEAQWRGYRNERRFFREMNRCGCGRVKRVTAIRCKSCASQRAKSVARSLRLAQGGLR